MFAAVKSFVEKNIDHDIDKKIKKIKDSFQNGAGSASSAGGSSSPSKLQRRAQRIHHLQYEQQDIEHSLALLPAPLPVLTGDRDFVVPKTTDYADTPFTFYYEDFEEVYPVPNALVEEDELPVIAEPTDGMHPYGFDVNQYNTKRNNIQTLDVKPQFLYGNNNPMKTFNQTIAASKVITLQDLQTTLQLSNLTYICISDTHLNTKTKKLMWKKLQQCPLVETLILKNIGIGGVQKSSRFPNLRFCDFSQNKIRSLRSIRKITKYSKVLEVLNLMGNPIVNDVVDYELKLSSKLPVLENVSQRQLSVAERINAIFKYGKPEAKARIENVRWAIHLDNIPEVRAARPLQPGWQPQTISHLTLTNSQLKYFYVGAFVSLRHLDLSNNMLTDITGAGIEKLEQVIFVSLRTNNLMRVDMLNIFEMTPSLHILMVNDNIRLTDYRLRVIYLTRNIKGTNRAPGIVQVDDQVVTREERIRAVEQFEPSTNGSGGASASAIIRWRLLLIERYGHKQLQSVSDYLTKVKCVVFPRAHLALCDVAVFQNVQVLDFSGNILTNFTGLQHLNKLRILYLHDNPSLDTNSILQQLVNFETLESITFFVDETTHQRSTSSKTYRSKLLSTIIPKNRNLMLVDNTTISYNERVDSYLLAGFPVEVVEKYRFFLGLTVNCTMHFNRGIQPDQVEIGKQYDPLEITGLRRLRDWMLVSEACNFAYFVNVTEIDLSNNRLVDIANLGLQTLNNLQRLSVINNQIQTPIPIIAQLLDQLKTLEIFAIRMNPVMKTPSDRLALIGSMISMKQLESTLKVIDTEITIYDKVEGWKLVGGSLRDAEIFKLSFITNIKQINLFEQNLVTLELSDCALEYLDVTPFVNLKALILPNNRFKSMENIPSLTLLPELFAIDLRFNEFKTPEEIRDTIIKIVGLKVLGVFGNPFTKSNNTYRVKFLSLILPLFQQHRYPLCMLDSSEITPEEITEACVQSRLELGVDKKDISFNIALLRRAITLAPDQLVELDIAGCGLTSISLQRCPNLSVLNLADNSISDTNLKESGINTLQSLRSVDLRNNRLKDLVAVCRVIDLLINLDILFIDENSCYEKENEKNRAQFFKKLTNPRIITSLKFVNGVAITPMDHTNFNKKLKK